MSTAKTVTIEQPYLFGFCTKPVHPLPPTKIKLPKSKIQSITEE